MTMPLKIQSVGRYLPSRIVTNEEIEEIMDAPRGSFDSPMIGVKRRRWVTDETATFMAAQAAWEALDKVSMTPGDLDLIINASGTPEQAIPDNGPLLQRHLGLGDSGITAFSVHSTCLSFLTALHVAATFLATDQYRTILIATGEISSVGLNRRDPGTFPLFGDVGAAAIVTKTPDEEPSCMKGYVFRTFGDGADLTAIPGCGTRRHPNAPVSTPEDQLFHMNGRKVAKMALEKAGGTLEMLHPGLSGGLGNIRTVIAHQASGLALTALSHFGWPQDRIVRTLQDLGNCIAGSLPATLYEAITQGKIERGDDILLVGTGAGLSIGATILTY